MIDLLFRDVPTVRRSCEADVAFIMRRHARHLEQFAGQLIDCSFCGKKHPYGACPWVIDAAIGINENRDDGVVAHIGFTCHEDDCKGCAGVVEDDRTVNFGGREYRVAINQCAHQYSAPLLSAMRVASHYFGRSFIGYDKAAAAVHRYAQFQRWNDVASDTYESLDELPVALHSGRFSPGHYYWTRDFALWLRKRRIRLERKRCQMCGRRPPVADYDKSCKWSKFMDVMADGSLRIEAYDSRPSKNAKLVTWWFCSRSCQEKYSDILEKQARKLWREKRAIERAKLRLVEVRRYLRKKDVSREA